VRDALGRMTAAPVRARTRSACAAMDGIAIKAPADAASRWRLAVGSFAWVVTGDLMPAGTDTVVERERVQLGKDGSA
jgi:molybdopterin biosynthesis enzyme